MNIFNRDYIWEGPVYLHVIWYHYWTEVFFIIINGQKGKYFFVFFFLFYFLICCTLNAMLVTLEKWPNGTGMHTNVSDAGISLLAGMQRWQITGDVCGLG